MSEKCDYCGGALKTDLVGTVPHDSCECARELRAKLDRAREMLERTQWPLARSRCFVPEVVGEPNYGMLLHDIAKLLGETIVTYARAGKPRGLPGKMTPRPNSPTRAPYSNRQPATVRVRSPRWRDQKRAEE